MEEYVGRWAVKDSCLWFSPLPRYCSRSINGESYVRFWKMAVGLVQFLQYVTSLPANQQVEGTKGMGACKKETECRTRGVVVVAFWCGGTSS